MPVQVRDQNYKPTRIRFRTTVQTKSNIKYEARIHHISQNQFINNAIEYYRDAVHHDFDTPSVLVQRVNELTQIDQYQGHLTRQLMHSVMDVLNRFMGMNTGKINNYMHHDK